MPRITTKGTCSFCRQSFAKGGISRHLEACEKRQAAMTETVGVGKSKVRTVRLFHLQVEGTFNPEYWMHVEIPADVSLKVLDTFLREVWLECCGHMSAFRIKGQSYSVYPQAELGDRSMNHKLEAVLSPGLVFGHEYDFGTTTELTLKVVGEREGQVRGRTIQVMARNEPPEIKCAKCDKPATQVCSVCIWEGGAAWLCDDHVPDHECGEDMFLPVVNSPRVGMCAYTGPVRGWSR
jgi:hypothetical protein